MLPIETASWSLIATERWPDYALTVAASLAAKQGVFDC